MFDWKDLLNESLGGNQSDSEVALEEIWGLNNHYDSLSPILSLLYREHKYHEILTLVPPINHLPYISSNIRLVFALTFIQLGRYKVGLRQLAIAIESEPDELEKVRIAKYLVRALEVLGFNQKSKICNTMVQQLAPNAVDLVSNMEHMRASADYWPLHIQAERFINAGGVLLDMSLGKQCMIINDIITKAIEDLNTKCSDSLQLLFKAIQLFGPKYLYNKTVPHIPAIQKLLDDEINKYPELNLKETVPNLLKMLIRLEKSSPNSLKSLTGILIKCQFLTGFLEYMKANFTSGAACFAWCIHLIESIECKLPRYINKTEYISEIVKRSSAILISQCIELGKLGHGTYEMETLLLKLTDGNYDSLGEIFSNRHSTILRVIGTIHERITLLSPKRYNVGDITLVKYDSTALYRMVKHYIHALPLSSMNDPSTLVILDKIIWGMLLLGGIHIETLWFFSDLKRYYQLKIDFGPLYVDDSDHESLFIHTNRTFSNMYEILNKIDNFRLHLSASERDTYWNPECGEAVLLPTAFELDDKIVVLMSFCDEESSLFKSENFELINGEIGMRLKTHVRLSNEKILTRYEMSREFIGTWVQYQDQYGEGIPQQLVESIQRLERS